MGKILALDTSTDACSAALWIDGAVFERFEIAPRAHTQKLLPMVQSLLDEQQLSLADLDAIAYGAGPGSFTGLRITAGVTQGLAYGAGLPVIAVSTLAAMAMQRVNDENPVIAVALDARMDELYFGLYHKQDQSVEALMSDQLCKPEGLVLPEDLAPAVAVGSGWVYRERLSAQVAAKLLIDDAECWPRAGAIATLADDKWRAGEMTDARGALPVYLRDEVTWKKLPGR